MAYTEVTLNQNDTNGQQIAVDQIGSIDFQRVKISVGTEGNATDVSTTDPLPISGTVTANTGLSQPLTDTQLRATPVPISGTVTANTGLTQPLTDTQLRATPVPVSAAALPLPALAATSTKQSDGSQKTQVVDGSGNVIGATSNALDINIKSGNPTTIAVTQGTATNLKAQAENYQGGAAVSSSNPLLVSLANTAANATAVKVDGSAVTQPVSIAATVTTTEAPATTVTSGKTTVTTAGTRVQLASNTCKSITIKGLNANTGTIYVGNVAVASSNGFELLAGDTISLDISNSNLVYIDSSVNGESVTWILIN